MTSINFLRMATLFVLLGHAAVAQANRSHVVSEGDTLWGISKSYGCDLGDLRQSNALNGDRLNVGQELQIPTCSSELGVRVADAGKADTASGVSTDKAELAIDAAALSYVIVPGDTLGGIASRFDTSIADLVARNHLEATTIFPGQKLELLAGKAEAITIPGQSIGLPYHGRLRDASELKQGPGYFIRRPHRAFGAQHTVGYLKRIIAEQGRRFPRLHRLAVGDLSAQKGGKISMHASHQSGRDVDLGFYFKSKPKRYPEEFVVANAKNLHFEATWALLTSFTDLADKDGGVEKIFLSYTTQRLFYRLARKQGVAKATLARMFQYPNGKSSTHGIIRHEPGHDEHMHVRFKCPPDDEKCQ